MIAPQALALLAILSAARPALAAGPSVTPPSIDMGTVHAGDVKVFTFRLANASDKPLKAACKGGGFTFAPATVTIEPNGSADVQATYRAPKRLRFIGRLDAKIACGGARLPIAGITDEGAVVPPPADAAHLAQVVVKSQGVNWTAYSPSKGLVNDAACNDPLSGDKDACCTLSLTSLDGKATVSYVLKDNGCPRAGARTADEVIGELSKTFADGGFIALASENWISDARLLPDGRLLVWRDGAVWLGDSRLATLAEHPTLLEVTPGVATALVAYGPLTALRRVAFKLP
jgi:hypothetical protein